MNKPLDYRATAEAMSDVQFELLLRARMQLMHERALARGASQYDRVDLSFRWMRDNEEKPGVGRWTVSFNYGEDTKGERLVPAVDEACRRKGWDSGPEASLLLLDAPPEKEH